MKLSTLQALAEDGTFTDVHLSPAGVRQLVDDISASERVSRENHAKTVAFLQREISRLKSELPDAVARCNVKVQSDSSLEPNGPGVYHDPDTWIASIKRPFGVQTNAELGESIGRMNARVALLETEVVNLETRLDALDAFASGESVASRQRVQSLLEIEADERLAALNAAKARAKARGDL